MYKNIFQRGLPILVLLLSVLVVSPMPYKDNTEARVIKVKSGLTSSEVEMIREEVSRNMTNLEKWQGVDTIKINK